MIKITLGEVVNSVESLRALLDLKLPVKVSYRISKLVNNKIDQELKVYNEQRNKLILEFGKENEAGVLEVKDPLKLREFSIKLQEILDLPVELDFKPLKIEDLGEISIEAKHLIPWLFV